MKLSESLSDSSCTNQTRLEDREFSAFIVAVTQLFGPNQPRRSAQDGLEELELMDSRRRSEVPSWRVVTIAASARLAIRVSVLPHASSLRTSTTSTKVSPIPSSNCFASVFLV